MIKYLGIILIYAHIKNTSFSLSNKCFLGVDSKSEIHFFSRYWKSPIIQKNQFFPDCRGFPVLEKNWTSELDSAGFINASIIREITANPKIQSS